VTQDPELNLWIGLGDGRLARLRKGQFDIYGKQDGLADDSVSCMHVDREANLWVGTEFGGLNRMQPRRLITYSTPEGLGSENVWCISNARDGGLWIGTDGGLTRYRNGVFVNQLLGDGAADNQVKTVLEDKDGNVWVGTRSRGIRLVRDNVVSFVSTTDRQYWWNGTLRDHDEINSLYQDRSGNIWAGTPEGLSQFEKGVRTRRYAKADGLPHNDVRAIHETDSGDLWVGTYGGGISRLRDGKFTTYTTQDGLSDNVVWIMHEGPNGSYWIGTEQGLTWMKDGRFVPITTRHGLFDNVINDVMADGFGYLWIGCNRGLYRVEERRLIDIVEKRATHVEYTSYGVSDGMRSSETNGENQPAACRAPDGMLWFPTTDGVVVIDPAQVPKNERRPPVVIETVRIDDKEYDATRPVRLSPGQGSVVEFRFTANSLTASDKVLFRYRLDGWDREWTRADIRREAFYTSLRPNRYTFRVIACNNHGLWNDEGDSFEFQITPHFYQTFPFYAAVATTLLAIGYGIHRIRVSVVKKIERLERQAALEKERTRIANDMHDDLGSSLTQIALTSELASRELSANPGAAGHVASITNTAREVFRAMDEIVWAVNPKHDSLDSLVAYVGRYSQRFLGQTGIRCRIDLPDQLPPCALTAEERHNLFLAVKEGLHNIVKHAGATEVWIRAAIDNGDCVITIQDDGRGFDRHSVRPEGNGLNNMHGRMVAVGGRFEIQTGHNGGTTLKLFVRLRALKTNGKANEP
jgi:signal transduction histidine kinase